MKVITILSKEGCPMCDVAMDICNEWGIPADKTVTSPNKLLGLTGQRGFPQILVDGEHIGGHLDLEPYIDKNFEPVLQENLSRYTTFPIKYDNLWSLYKSAVASFWTVEEVDLSKDLEDWNKLKDSERHFITTILAFFASSDGIVMENISCNFSREVQLSEARSFYAYQEFNESIHGETYSLLIEKYITDPVKKQEAFNAIEKIPCIRDKAQWAMKWFDSTSIPFVQRLVAFACVEGIFFSGSFCAIFWLKKRGILPGLSFSNELISRDEALHLEFAVSLYHQMRNKPPPGIVREIIEGAVQIEKAFIVEALPCRLIGMDSSAMSTYIEFVADRLMKQLGFPPIYKSKNPFDFMEAISLEGKTNFFEKRVAEYGKHGVGLSADDNKVAFDEDF